MKEKSSRYQTESREGPNKVYQIKCRTCETAGRPSLVVESRGGLNGLVAMKYTAKHNQSFLEKHSFIFR